VFVVARSTVILIVCTAKKREERGKEEEEEKKERRARAHTYILQQSTLDNYDLWPRRMRVENIILSKDSRCRRHWLIVNKNNNNNNHYQRY
jgi:hypothetical protein